MKVFFIAIYLFLGYLILGCQTQKSDLDLILDDLFKMSINQESIEKLFTYKDEILQSKNSRELTRIAYNIHLLIGPFSDNEYSRKRLDILISFLEKALELNPGNRAAYQYQVNFLNEIGELKESLRIIDVWLRYQKGSYSDFLKKALIYEALNMKDSAETYLLLAEEKHNNTCFRKNNIDDRFQLAIIKAFLYGEEAGLKEMESLLDETNDPLAFHYKSMYFENFNREFYINHVVFGQALTEINIDVSTGHAIRIENGDTIENSKNSLNVINFE